MEDNLTQEQAEAVMRRTAYDLLRRRRDANHAKELSDASEERFLQRAAEFGITCVELPEATIQVIEGERRNISVELLAETLPKDTFEMVTKRAVVLERLDQAVALGLVMESIAKAATKVTPYKNVRVNVH